MRFSLAGYLISETGKSILRNRLSSLLSCATTAFALFLLGTSFLISLNVSFLMEVVEEQMEVQIYLKQDAISEEVQNLLEVVQKTPGVTQVKYVSREEALEELKTMFGDKASVLEGLKEENPLPASIRFKTSDPGAIPAMVEEFKKNDLVCDVIYQEEAARRLASLGRMSQIVSLGGMIIVGLVAVMVIGNSVRLTIEARRHEVGIMKLVGATDEFIIGPFLFEGIVLGALGGVVAAFMVAGLYVWVYEVIRSALPFIPVLKLSLSTAIDMLGIMLSVGVLVGATGSVVSLRKHLRV